jgi:hypothetical protein
MSSAARKPKGPGLRQRLHRGLIAVEAVLVIGVLKDWIWRQVRVSDLPSWDKVLFAMATTVGLFGGLFLALQGWAARGVSKTHQAARGLPVALPTLLIHAALLFVLFLLYAWMLGIRVL